MFRSVLVMHHLEQKELRQVALELGTSVAAAKSRLHRARRELKSRMAKYGVCPPPGIADSRSPGSAAGVRHA